MQESKMLINEQPLQVLPTLAKLLDINKAIILQQIHYWLIKSGHDIDGKLWVYNSYDAWSVQFPWLTARAVRHHISELEKDGYLIPANYNNDSRDKTKWYTINYDALNSMTNSSCHETNFDSPCGKIRPMHVAKNGRALPENTTETTTDNKTITKKVYGEFSNVRLTDEEHAKLVERFNSHLTELIEKLSAYKASTGRTYKSDYATILNWERNKPTVPVKKAEKEYQPW